MSCSKTLIWCLSRNSHLHCLQSDGSVPHLKPNQTKFLIPKAAKEEPIQTHPYMKNQIAAHCTFLYSCSNQSRNVNNKANKSLCRKLELVSWKRVPEILVNSHESSPPGVWGSEGTTSELHQPGL